MNTPPTEYVTDVAAIAREAGALLMAHFGRRRGFEYKGDVDLVTEADRASEALILERIQARWPRHDLVAEEGSRRETGSDFRWHVDPLDGTTNFAHGFPVFCVSIALEHKAKPVAGVIYDPTRDELYAAERGSGAYLNQRRMRVSQTDSIYESLVATGFPSHKRHQNPNIHLYHQITLRSHGVRRAGSAALDLAAVAAGRFEGFWEFNLNSWDTAAGVLLVEEAGGQVSGFGGEPYQITSRDLLASNGLIHAELLKTFAAIFAGRDLEPLPSFAEYVRSRKKVDV